MRIFAFVAAILLSPPQATFGQVQDDFNYWLDIDCDRSVIRGEGTRSLYSIVGITDDGVEYPFSDDDTDADRLTDQDCRSGVVTFVVSLSEPVNMRHIRVELLEGRLMDDALFLDFLQLSIVGPDLEDSIGWDEDEGGGWCLSADPDDGRRDWTGMVFDEQCYPCLEFSLIPVTEGDQPIIDGNWVDTAIAAYSECPVVESSG